MLTKTQERNPFPVYEQPVDEDNPKIIGWKWFDETGRECDIVFPTQAAAVRNLSSYIHWLDHGPTMWQSVWWPIRYKLWPKIVEFLHS